MNTINWILLGIIGVSLLLYFIFTFGKKIELGQNITSIFPIPVLGILSIIMLFSYIPDSYHIIKISIIAFTFITVSYILKTFGKSIKTKWIAGILFILSLWSFFFIYKSVFFIYRVPLWINIIAVSAYFAVFLIFFLVFIKKQNFAFYLFAIISLFFVSMLHYCSIISLCFVPKNYNIVKLIGFTSIMGYVVFDLLNNSILNLKLKKFIGFITLFVSLILISFSNIMILN